LQGSKAEKGAVITETEGEIIFFNAGGGKHKPRNLNASRNLKGNETDSPIKPSKRM
jgi:hypothetical protein